MESKPPTDPHEQAVKRKKTIGEQPATPHGLQRLCRSLGIPADKPVLRTLEIFQPKIL